MLALHQSSDAMPTHAPRTQSCEPSPLGAGPAPVLLAFTGSSTYSVAPKHDIFIEGDTAGFVYEILEGTVNGYRILPGGERHVVAFYFAGDLLGYGVTETYLMSAQAVTNVRVRRIPRATVERMLDARPELARTLLRRATEELSATRDHLLCIAAKSADAKISSFLIALSRRNRSLGLNAAEVDLPMTRLDIGDYLGLTVETVSRTLTRLKLAGVIALPRSSRVVIRDQRTLEAMSNA